MKKNTLRKIGASFVLAGCAVTLSHAEDGNDSLLDTGVIPGPVVWINVDVEEQSEEKEEEAGIKVVNNNGETTVFYEGEKVWEGKTKGKVSAKATEVDGKKYAVAMDGEQVIWEKGERPKGEDKPELDKVEGGIKMPGGRLLGGDMKGLLKGDFGGLGVDLEGMLEEGLIPDFGGEGIGEMNSMKVISINGNTVVYYQGEKVWEGKTTGVVSTKATNINGKKYAVAKDDDRILWEIGDGVGGDVEPGADF